MHDHEDIMFYLFEENEIWNLVWKKASASKTVYIIAWERNIKRSLFWIQKCSYHKDKLYVYLS